ncbi:hypothetical protein [uncultured Draconibacterium sp.]|uniref:hypothetical protein n=1 Tax=uncultured Draconibacterium sp. TaxID=1573823 RepID=UPI0032617372
MQTEETFNEQVSTEYVTGKIKQQLELTETINRDLHAAGKWSYFLSIVGFIGTGLMVIAGLTVSIVMAFLPNKEADIFPFPPVLLGLLYLIMAVVYFFPILYLFRFSNSIKSAVALKQQQQLAKAFTNLKAHYKTFGIIMIVFLCLYPILIIGMVLFGIFSGIGGAEGIPA